MTLTRHDDLSLRYVLNVPSGKPDNADMPLVLLMHGRGADANDLADIAPMIDGGYRFVFPNAAKAFEPMPGYSFGFSWFDGWPPRATPSCNRARNCSRSSTSWSLAIRRPRGKSSSPDSRREG